MQGPRVTSTCRRKIICSECKTGRPYSKENKHARPLIPDDLISSISVDDVDFNIKAYESFISKCNHTDFMWLVCSNGKTHTRAVQGGRTRTGEPIYIARARSPEWNMCLGCFLPSRGTCYIQWRGTAISCNEYELLCRREKKLYKNCLYPNPAPVTLENSLKILSFKSPLKPHSYG